MPPGALEAEADLPRPFMPTRLPKQFLVAISRSSLIKPMQIFG